ncbi:hypothetical protein CONCODRAFT_20753 [Conidiobolus coronatus NRRL 28638]|uniref:RRM domain-containing protein n=1 Tax=Conidiobolus coronatus (strain ATCC 28846 / CBS 209.66 / NRRL 28638) TaxID=796925 RepID=A0A137NRI4_CONC2|nr:hypothetical protein CONCODRAFT_20753 [Conidiobolus coronatus NRRL 28638]|eukprot:KXN65373.1 hypothetical protein CONCODRAFT_20753 [Conidiobolus coronatus NRRL 28638]
MPRLFVGRLSKIFYEDQSLLTYYFSQFGKVRKVEVKEKFNQLRGKTGYFGIVSFIDSDASVNHIIRLSDTYGKHVIGGKEVDVGIYYGAKSTPLTTTKLNHK